MANILPDDDAKELMRLQSQMETQRSVFDVHYREVAERVLPRYNDFQTQQAEGAKRTERIFDSTALLALDRAASAVDSLITPATQMYQGFEPEDYRLAGDREVKLYCDELAKALFRARYRPSANFASQAHECYLTTMAFGTMGMFTDEVVGVGLRYKSIGLADLYIAENYAGIVDMVHRRMRLTARQAVQKFGRNKLPEPIIKAEEKEPLRKFEFFHCVRPNNDMDARRKDWRGMSWSSYYVCKESRTTVDRGGYRTMPYSVARFVTSPNEVYGRSPAMMVLPDIKMVNEMEKTIIRAAHKIVDPPMLAYGDGALSVFNARPAAMNYGGVDEQGRQLIVPLKTGSNLPIALEMTEQKRKVINDAFYITLFQILVQNPQMTATEALIRAQEKGQLLAPTAGRQESEFLGPNTQRELDILAMAQQLPPMPEKLRRAGGLLKITHTSPLSRMRRAEDGVAIMRTIEAVTPLANIRPEILDRFDPDMVVQELCEINGVPERVLRPFEVMVAERAQKKQAEQMMVDLQGADVAANAARNMSKAAEIAGFVAPAGTT